MYIESYVIVEGEFYYLPDANEYFFEGELRDRTIGKEGIYRIFKCHASFDFENKEAFLLPKNMSNVETLQHFCHVLKKMVFDEDFYNKVEEIVTKDK